jgi:vancomycin resistance protein YoaR
VAVAAVLLLGAATAVAASTDVPRGTTVLGIDIGGQDKQAASKALLSGVAARLSAPVAVTVGSTSTTLDPERLDLHLDAPGTVDRAASGWPNPLQVLFGRERPVEPVVTVDEGKVDAAITDRSLTEALGGRIAKRAAITFDGLTPQPTYAVAGMGVDQAGAATALREGWLRGEEIALPVTNSVPITTDAEVDRVLRDFARPAVAAPVTVPVAGKRLALEPTTIAKSLVITADESGALKPRVDEKRLRSVWARQLARVETAPRDAAVPTAGGEKIIASTGGKLVDTAKLGRDLLGVLPKAAPRDVPAVLSVVPAKATSAELSALGVVERISSFTTRFDGGQDRNKNIIQVAKEVDGAIVEPGETFSLNGYTGPRGYAEGYVDAPVISDGKLVNAVGGGISQFTTTLFNAAYYAGLEDVFHQPHSYYFSRYPSVIEATIFYPSLDMRFRNDSATSVLIDTAYDDTSVTVTMWGTKRYDVSTEWGPKTDITKPKTVHLEDERGCIATRGIDGFSQQAWRIFEQDGREVKREVFSHDYQAEPRFVCDR